MRTPLRLASAALVVALCVAFSSRIETDNRIESWIDPSPQAQRHYENLKQTFGSDEFLVIAVSGDDLFSEDSLDLQLDALERLESIEGVVNILSPATVYRELFGAEEPAELHSEITSTDFYEGLIVSDDGSTAAYFVSIEPPALSKERLELLAQVNEAMSTLEQAGFDLRLAGSLVLAAELDRSSFSEALRSLPLAALASSLLLALLLRSVRGTLVAVLCSLTTVALMLGLMGALERPLNMFTAALPAILWVLSLAAVLHLLVRYRRELRSHPHNDALALAIARAKRPCALSSATTAAGFYSLNLAPMTPVRELGTLTGTGILLSCCVTFWLAPALIDLLRPSAARIGAPLRGLSRLSGAAFERPGRALLPFAALAIAGVFGLSSIELSSNPLSLLPDDAPILDDYREIGERLGGMSSFEIVVPTPDGWLDPALWERFERFEEVLSSDPDIAKIRSPLALLKKLHQWDQDFSPASYRLPADRESAIRLVSDAGPIVRRELDQLAAADGSAVRLSAFVTTTDSERFAEIAELARTQATQILGTEVAVTGVVSLLVDAQQELIHSQLVSLALAVTLIFFCLWIGHRSGTWAYLTLVPNLVPVSAVFFLLSLFGLPLDPGTIMVAGIALGIAVDDSVHLATSLRRHYGEHPTREGVETSVQEVGAALVVTSLTAAVGFLSLAIARFLPIRYFGLLSASAMIVALGAGLIVLPALLSLRYHRNEQFTRSTS